MLDYQKDNPFKILVALTFASIVALTFAWIVVANTQVFPELFDA